MAHLIKRLREIGLKRFLKKATFYDEVYSIGIRKKEMHKDDSLLDLSSSFEAVPQNEDIWMADPLLFTKDDKDWLFVELYEKACSLGRIAVIDPDCLNKEPVIIIKEPYHMSFPMVFEWNGDYFMIPETSGNHSINLYQCEQFPYRWKLICSFSINALIVDSVVIDKTSDCITLLGSETRPENELLVHFVTYKIYKTNNGYQLDYSAPDSVFTYTERNGGYPVVRNLRSFLVTQNSSTIDYGISLSRSSYEQDAFAVHETIRPDMVQMRGIEPSSVIGVHTYSEGIKYEVIDMRYLKFDLLLNFRRIGYRRKKK